MQGIRKKFDIRGRFPANRRLKFQLSSGQSQKRPAPTKRQKRNQEVLSFRGRFSGNGRKKIRLAWGLRTEFYLLQPIIFQQGSSTTSFVKILSHIFREKQPFHAKFSKFYTGISGLVLFSTKGIIRSLPF